MGFGRGYGNPKASVVAIVQINRAAEIDFIIYM